MAHAIHHHHKRTRTTEAHPFLDKIIYIVAIFGPIMTIPQVLQIWITQDASGVSVISWSAYIFSSCIWITYGFAHKEKVIIFNYFMWFTMEVLVVTGTLLYG